MELITILNRCHRFPGFVYQQARFSADHKSIEISVRPRKRSVAICSRCRQPAPGYDQLAERRFELTNPPAPAKTASRARPPATRSVPLSPHPHHLTTLSRPRTLIQAPGLTASPQHLSCIAAGTGRRPRMNHVSAQALLQQISSIRKYSTIC